MTYSYYSCLLITPDGEQWDLNELKWQVDLGIPDGFSLPEIAHDTQVLYNQPGALLKSIQVLPRTVTITAKLVGDCRDELHRVRAALWQALRWNREGTNPPSYSILRYQANGRTADLHCYYLSDVVSGGDGEQNQAIGYRLVAYDPYWYGDTLNSQNLGLQTTLGVSYNAAKVNGVWDALGNNGSVVAILACSAYDADRDVLYVGGAFTNWAGIAAADRIAKYDFNTNTWSALGGSGADGQIRDMVLGSDGMLYVGGDFTNIGGIAVNFLARYNPDTDTFSALTTGLNDNYIDALAFDFSRSRLYIGGEFTTWNGVARARICYYDLSTSTWVTMGAGANQQVRAMRIMPSGILFVGGSFTTILGTSASRIARYDPVAATMTALGSGVNQNVFTIAVAPNGDVYAGGDFTLPAQDVACWNGTQWLPLISITQFDQAVYALEFDADGLLYIGGSFTTLTSLSTGDRIVTWNGSTFAPLDIDLPGAAVVLAISVWADGLHLMFTTAGDATVSYSVSDVPILGDVESYPVFTVTGPGTLQRIENIVDGKKMIFNSPLSAGEIATIDLTPLEKSFSSNMRGSLFPYSALLPSSDFASWSLLPTPVAPDGDNDILLYISGTTPVENGDNNNQLSGWGSITGITFSNTNNGKLYVNIVDDGGGFWHVNLYSNVARSVLVGHTASYNSNGAKAIVADGASGLGGTVTVDARTAADTDIVVYFSVAKIEWYDRFLSADSAVAPDRIK